MPKCLICGDQFLEFINAIRDYEYGVKWSSKLIKCRNCSLVTQDPDVTSEQIPKLYPKNYLAHSQASRKRGIYGILKQVLANRAVKKITKYIPPHGSFLEVGCGNGHFLTRVANERSDIKLLGVDIQPYEGESIANFRFFHGQFEDQDIESGSVDLIYFSNLIEHVEDPKIFLQQCLKILREGGKIYGVTPNHLSWDRFIFWRFWAGYHYPRHTYLFDHKNLRRFLEELGFINIQIKGAYAYWYLSLANIFLPLHGQKKRGILFALVTAFFLPLDFLINLVTVHGSMTFTANIPVKPIVCKK